MADNVIYCSKCGAPNNAAATFCHACGASMGTGLPAVATPAAPAVVYAPAVTVPGYGGFWIRFVAFVVDSIIVRLIAFPFAAVLTAAGVLHRAGRWGRIESPEDVIPIVSAALGGLAVVFVIAWLYEALLTSSEWQATLGKKMLNLRVTDEAENRISFARASGRHFAKYISSFLLIGYIMAAFTDRKRALHDMLAGTLVRKG